MVEHSLGKGEAESSILSGSTIRKTKMRVGITGTRNPITDKQVMEIVAFLNTLPEGSELHHGDCLGADHAVAKLASYLGIKTICHPPERDELRAYHESTETRDPRSYLARNRNIVGAVGLLMVVPMQDEWQPMGGTWYTHDYAKKKNVPVKMFWPNKPA